MNMKKIITLRNGIWYTDFALSNGRRVRKSTGFKKHQQSEALLRAVEIQRALEHPVLSQLTSKPTWGYAIDQAMERHYKNLPSYRKTKSVEKLLVEYWPRETLLEDIRESDIEAYMDWRLQEVKPATVNRELNVISKIFELAVNVWKFHGYKPKIRKLPVRDAAHKRIMTHDEEQSMYRYFSETEPDMEMFDLVRVLIDTGMRLGEAQIVSKSRLDISNGFVQVPDSKSAKGRSVPLVDTALEILQRRTSQGNHAFPQDPRTYQRKFEAFRDHLNPPDRLGFSLKMLRHTFATRMLLDGFSISQVQHWLGHSDIKTTQIYLTITQKDLLSARDRMNELRQAKIDTQKTVCTK